MYKKIFNENKYPNLKGDAVIMVNHLDETIKNLQAILKIVKTQKEATNVAVDYSGEAFDKRMKQINHQFDA